MRRSVELEVDRSAFDLHAGDTVNATVAGGDLPPIGDTSGDEDSKYATFERVLGEALAPGSRSKALVFSFFRGTLDYLHERLRRAGWRVALIHGGVPLAERRRVIERFRDDPGCKVMLSSEVGAEGLDFQFCDVLVNYDLPWNPMQVEQRIGRLDRFGQQAERIRIYNFYIQDTIETRIFQRLYDRIGIFERSIGDLEAILGNEIVKLSRDVLQASLTPAEEEARAIQAGDTIRNRQQAEEELERHKDSLLGQGVILDQQVERAIDAGHVISIPEVRALVVRFVLRRFPRSRIVFDYEEPCATLEMDASLVEALNRFIERGRLHARMSSHLKDALSGKRKLALTFDADLARRRPNLEFMTVRHPLAEMATEFWKSEQGQGIPAGALSMVGPTNERGTGHFFVYCVEVRAAKPSVTLESVVVLDDGRFAVDSATVLLKALQDEAEIPNGLQTSTEAFCAARERAEERMAARRLTIEAEARRRNDALLAARRSSVRASFDAKIKRTKELYESTLDESIRRMRASQVDRLHHKLDARLDELERCRDVAVSSRLVIGGRILIR